jgi:hypothetical protein
MAKASTPVELLFISYRVLKISSNNLTFKIELDKKWF